MLISQANAALRSIVLHKMVIMGKIRYICTACANGFTTKSAAHRHLKKVEQGKGMIVTEANYRTGLATGVFFPVFMNRPPKYKKTGGPSTTEPAKRPMEEEEFRRGFWRRAGELVCEEAFKDENKRRVIKTQVHIFLLNDVMKPMVETKLGSSTTGSSNIQ